MKKITGIGIITLVFMFVGCGVKNNPPTGPSVTDRGANYFNEEGWRKYAQGDYYAAKANFDTVLSMISPENIDAYLGSSMAMKQIGEFSRAHGYVTMAITVSNQERQVIERTRRFEVQTVSPVNDTLAWITFDTTDIAYVNGMEITVALANTRYHNLDSAVVYDTLYGGPAGSKIYFKVISYSFDGDSVLIAWDNEKNFASNTVYAYERTDLPPDSMSVDTTLYLPDSIVVDTTYYYPIDTLQLVRCLPLPGDTVIANVAYVVPGNNNVEDAAHIVDGAIYFADGDYFNTIKWMRASILMNNDFRYNAPYADSLPGRLINTRNAKILLAQSFYNLGMYRDAAYVVNDLYGQTIVDPENPDIHLLFNSIVELRNQGGL